MRKVKTLSTCTTCLSLISSGYFKRRRNPARVGIRLPKARGGDFIIKQTTLAGKPWMRFKRQLLA